MTKLIKQTLEIKLKDLGSPFSYSDIHVHKSSITDKEWIELGFDFIDRKYILTINGYENIEFIIYIGYDNYFSHYCYITSSIFDCYITCSILDRGIFASSIADVFTAIQKAVLQLGYNIHSLF